MNQLDHVIEEPPTDPALTAIAADPWVALGLEPDLLAAVADRGYARPTLVQQEAVPIALTGRDLLVRSKTGTGKTAAFLLPTLQRIPKGYGRPGVIVLCPTRELALQISEEAEVLSARKGLKVTTLYGGVPMGAQVRDLQEGAEVIVGTPGRVLDHMRRGNLRLEGAFAAILDEADEMLSMGFIDEVCTVLDTLPPGAQTLLFSATVEGRLKDLVGEYLKDPHEIFLSVDGDRAPEGVTHILYETSLAYPKPRQLLHIVEAQNPKSAIVFCNTKSDTELVARFLERQGLVAQAISSDLPQRSREQVMARIKRGEIDFLIATDLASRGIDIQDLGHVFNYSLPEDPAVYLHRTGRTGRIGKTGVAVSLMSGREANTRKALERDYGVKFEIRGLPNKEDAERLWAARQLAELQSAVSGGLAFEGFLPLARSLREKAEGGDILVAAALRGFFRWHRLVESSRTESTESEDPGEGVANAARDEARGPEPRPDQGPRGGGYGGGGGGQGRNRRRR